MTTTSPRMFAQITKVDAAKREVWGRLVQEVPDRSGEIFDYESSKPYFKAWNEEFAAATDGKSLGNMRAMHGKVAAGKFTQVDFNDAEKAIDVCGKVVDEQEWNKVLEGVYTGYSIGGSYVGEKKTEKIDGADIVRYTAKPTEGSLVDSPCVPTAKFFDIVKADGAIEKIAFKEAATVEEIALEVTGSDEEVAAFAKALNDGGLSMADAIAAVNAAAATKQADADDELVKGALAKPLIESDSQEAFDSNVAAEVKAGTSKEQAVAIAYAVQRKAKAKNKKATTSDVDKGMWNVQDFASALACIASVAASAESDAQWEGDGSAVPEKLRGWLGDGVKIFQDMAKEEADELLASLKEQAGEGAMIGVELAAATRGTNALYKQLTDPALTLTAATAIAKQHGVTLEVGEAPTEFANRIMAKAKMSTANMDRLQAAHDHLANMGAACGMENAAKGNLAKGAPSIAKAVEEATAPLIERIAKLEAQPLALRTAALAGIKTVNKAQDTVAGTPDAFTEKEYVYNPDGSINDAATVTKFVQSLGGRRITAQTFGQS